MAVVIVAMSDDEDNIVEKVGNFDENSEVDSLLHYALIGWAFRIPHKNDRELWNKIINEKWRELDDEDYYYYNQPVVFDDEWITSDGGSFLDLETVLYGKENKIKHLKMIKNLEGGKN